MRELNIELTDCPDTLQAAVQKKLAEPDSKVCSVSLIETTPFKDKSVISRKYRVIMNRMNLVSVLYCYDDGVLSGEVFTSEMIWGDILEIIRTAPDASSLAMLRNALPEHTREFLSL